MRKGALNLSIFYILFIMILLPVAIADQNVVSTTSFSTSPSTGSFGRIAAINNPSLAANEHTSLLTVQELTIQGIVRDAAGNLMNNRNLRVIIGDQAGTPIASSDIPVNAGIFNSLVPSDLTCGQNYTIIISLLTAGGDVEQQLFSQNFLACGGGIATKGLSVQLDASMAGNLNVIGNVQAGGTVCDGSGKCISTIIPATSAMWNKSAMNNSQIYYNDGFVGIGLSTPGERLDVNGNILGRGSINATGLICDGSGRCVGDTTSLWNQSASPAGAIYYTGGNVGIGTPVPNARLTVGGDLSLWGGRISFFDSTGDAQSDPYYLLKTNSGDDTNALQLHIEDNNNESFEIWGNNCAAPGGCLGPGEKTHYFQSNGNAWHKGNLTIGGDFRSSGAICDGSGNCLNALPLQVWNQSASPAGAIYYTGGNVGIKRSTPGFALDVVGRSRITEGSDSTAGLWFAKTQGEAHGQGFVGLTNENNLGLYGINGAGWGLVLNTTSGNVGIGTSSPSAKLDVKGGAVLTDRVFGFSAVQQGNSSVGVFISAPVSQSMGFFTNSGERVRIDSLGNVGIGTTTPLSPFDVNGSIVMSQHPFNLLYISQTEPAGSDDAEIRLVKRSNPNIVSTKIVLQGYSEGTGGNLDFYTKENDPNAPLKLAVRFNESGAVGIGTPSPKALLHITADNITYRGESFIIETALPRIILKDKDSAGAGVNKMAIRSGDENRDGFAIQGSNDAGTGWNDLVFVTRQGNMGVGTTSPGAKLTVSSPAGQGDALLLLEDTLHNHKLLIGTDSDLPNFIRIRPYGTDTGLAITNNGDTIGVFVSAAPGANVGIGTAAPGNDKLDVRGRAYSSGGWQTTDADYAEWFEKEEPSVPGDSIGINLATGKVRKFQSGDKFLGIHASSPGIVGNRLAEDDADMEKTHTLVSLLGQVDANLEQAVLNGRVVSTVDGQYIGLLLSDGRIFIGR
ncbi:hypothetical protein J4460_03140 [Candidatus Woesearchaeota archaeon]|nr:hypothetical protein [Candidatus Woesearchaeota archaeon]HIH48810.1 hypothetical protein [Candidatus Woesearchaeota archaeon]HIJ02952.1 hypothetical protein [Candidatus Woesearchaeota archaeon]